VTQSLQEGAMESHVLIVANRTAATPGLLAEVRERVARGPCRFTLLVPRPFWDPDTEESAITLELALPLLEEAAGADVQGMIGDSEPLAAIQDALNLRGFHEVILSTLPARVSRWLKLDLPSKVSGLGVPVTTVTARSKAEATTSS
jgi:hypothetical protein